MITTESYINTVAAMKQSPTYRQPATDNSPALEQLRDFSP